MRIEGGKKNGGREKGVWRGSRALPMGWCTTRYPISAALSGVLVFFVLEGSWRYVEEGDGEYMHGCDMGMGV